MRKDSEHYPLREKWIKTAGDWADEPIRRFSRRDVEQFQTAKEVCFDVTIDPRRILYMFNPRYTQGMTWREFLTGGGNIDNALYVLTKTPEYYDDPLAEHPGRTSVYGSPQWTLIEIDGCYSADEGHHRSAIAKFRAHEEGVKTQRIPRLERFEVDHEAEAAADQLSRILRRGQCFEVLREPVETDVAEREEWRILFLLRRVRGHDGYAYPPGEALAHAEVANRLWRPYDVVTSFIGLFRKTRGCP